MRWRGGDLLIVEVQPAFSPPVRYRGRTFIRIGPRRDIATLDEERRLTEKRMSNMATFDALPCYKATLADVDVDFVREEYISKAVDADELRKDTRSIQEQMASLGLYDLQYNCPTNACIILFGKRPKQFLPGMYLQYVRYAGEDKGGEILDDKPFESNLSRMMPQLEAFIDYGVVHTRPVAVSSLREKTLSNYPKEALRELILNACMHRDYQSNAPTRFYQFDDRIEIMNPGGLYGKARPENFPHVNDYRNPIIAQALKVLGYVNMFNRGISRVKRLMLDNGGEEPRFDITKITAFEVLSYSAMEMPDSQRKVLSSEAEFSQLITKIFTKLVPDYFPSKEEKNLSVLIRSLIEPQKATDLSALLGLTDRTLRNRYLAKMLRAGVIELTIPDKPTSRNQRYRLKK